MKYWASLGLSFFTILAEGQEKDLSYYYNQAEEAYRAKAHPKFYEMIKEANRIHPYHQGILYQLGMAAALTGHKAEAIENLKKAILIDASFKLEGLADFNSIKNTPEFRSLLELQREWQRPVIHSDTAFVLHDRSLHTEGIDYDASDKTFYLGSIHKRKIVKVTASGDATDHRQVGAGTSGQATDFCPEGFEGMTSIFGIKVDSKNKILWACSSPMQEMKNYDSAARSAVFKFELSTGKLLEKIQRPKWEKDGVFGDLILNKKGDVFVSDSQTNTIFIIHEKTHQLEPYFTSPDFWNIQGLSFSDNEKFLFISDYVKGIYRLELKTKTLTEVKCNLDVSLKGIDGLVCDDHSLIAIQNGTNPLRVSRYILNTDQNQIIQFEIIDRKHPAFNEPTLGVVAGKTFYYIANSQWSGYDNEHHIKPDDLLQDIVILKAKLRD